MYQLYERYGHLYDLHTPAHHYQDDHRFVLDLVAPCGAPPRLLDLGCGTGVLLEKARQRGFHAHGIDAAEGMIRVAQRKLGAEAAVRLRMQELDDDACWDAISALSWTLNYASDEQELLDVLGRVRRALRPGGLLIAQLAHAPGATGEDHEDLEPGPTGVPGDIRLGYCFRQVQGIASTIEARYRFRSASTGDRLEEIHTLQVADLYLVQELARHAGLERCRLLGSWKGEPFSGGLSGWLLAHRPKLG